ncbi:MAG TPA: hypothetical protein VIJ28_14060 [Chloroflexota bacterium]|jgi:hypothetical protein
MRYDSFRLRVWRGTRHDRVQWSARLEGLQDGVELTFNSPMALFEHLRVLLDPDQPNNPGAGDHHGIDRPDQQSDQ